MTAPLKQIALCLHPGAEFMVPIVRGVAKYLAGRNDWSIYVHQRVSSGVAATLSRWEGEGVICSIMNDDDRRYVNDLPMPVVNITGALTNPGVPSVIGDDAAVGRVAADHLLACGFDHVALLGWNATHFGRRRGEAFTQACIAAHVTVHALASLDELGELPRNTQVELIAQQLVKLPRPLGVFAVFDALAQLVIDACHQAELRVPEDVAVLGVDNSPTICVLCNPPLSSVSQNMIERGRTAASLLDSLLGGQMPPDEAIRVLPDGVVSRRSTDVFAVVDDRVRDAMRYITDHAADGLSVDDVAKAVSMSRRNLERRFRQATRNTVYDHIRRARLEKAKVLLSTTLLPMIEVAMDSGFRSSSDLSNIFREHFGLTPSEYRRKFNSE